MVGRLPSYRLNSTTLSEVMRAPESEIAEPLSETIEGQCIEGPLVRPRPVTTGLSHRRAWSFQPGHSEKDWVALRSQIDSLDAAIYKAAERCSRT